MSYDIKKSNGNVINIPGSALNTSDTSLQLIGRAFRNYGSALNTNFLHLLENFSRTAAPANPIIGQLWFDTSANKIFLFDNTSNWTTIGGGGGAGPIFAVSAAPITDPVIGFVHNTAIVGAFSTGNTTRNNLSGTLSAVFSQGINRGLNIGNIENAGVYGTSGLHFGLGNNPPVITVLTSITSIFGNVNIFGNAGIPNPTITVSAIGIGGTNTLRFNAGSSGQSLIEFNSIANFGNIIQNHNLNKMSFNSNKFEFIGANTENTANFKNNENVFVTLETLLGKENKIIHIVDGNPKFSSGLDIFENYTIFNNILSSNALFIAQASNNVGINTNTPSVEFEVNGTTKVNQLTVSANGTLYSLPASAGITGQILVSNGNGGVCKWENISIDSTFIANSLGTTGVYTELSPNQLIFKANNIDSLTINSDGDLLSSGNLTVSGLSISNPLGIYSLPLSAGVAGQILVSDGDGNKLFWIDTSEITFNFIKNPAETVGFYSNLINEAAVIQTSGANRLIVTSDGKFGFNTDSPAANISLIAKAGNYLDFASTGNEASYTITTFDNAGLFVVSGNSSTVRTSFKTINANTSGRVRYTFFEDANNTGIKEVLFYQGIGSNEVDARIGVDGRSTFFNTNGGNVGIGTSAPNAKLDVIGRGKFQQITVSSDFASYSLPNTTGTPGQCITATTSSQLKWNTPFQGDKEGYVLENINEYRISLVELSATNWINIPFNSTLYDRILINFNDLIVSANNTLSDLRIRVLSSGLTSFGSAYSSTGIYNISFTQTNDSEWVFENFFNAVSGVFVSQLPASFKASLMANGINNPVVMDTHYTSFSSAGFRKSELTSGFIPANAINENIVGIIINSSNKIKILSGWLSITGVKPKNTTPLPNITAINFTP